MCITNDKSCFGKKVSKKLELVLLSNNVIQSQINDSCSNIFDQVIADIKSSPLKVCLCRLSSDIFYFRINI